MSSTLGLYLIFLLITRSILVTGLQCLHHLCWGVECKGFDPHDNQFIDMCPAEAEGCLHSYGTGTLVTPIGNQSIRRETRNCWIPSSGVEEHGGGELNKCTTTSMLHWYSKAGQMIRVVSTECLCSEDLCNRIRMFRNCSKAIMPIAGLVHVVVIISFFVPLL